MSLKYVTLGGQPVIVNNMVTTVIYSTDTDFYTSGHKLDRNYTQKPIYSTLVQKHGWRIDGEIVKHIGRVIESNRYGLYGSLDKPLEEKQVQLSDDIAIGGAILHTTIIGNAPMSFKCMITKIKYKGKQKHISLIITDKRLVTVTNGGLMGMSGSPVLQNDKIVGALTHCSPFNRKKCKAVLIRYII